MTDRAVPMDMESAQRESVDPARARIGDSRVATTSALFLPSALVLASVLCAAGRASAETSVDGTHAVVVPDHPVSVPSTRHRTFGMTMDLGVPDGAALGLVVRPRFDWLRLSVAVTHNTMAPGARLGVTFDPIVYPMVPTFTVEGGHYWAGTLPLVKDSTSIGYNYANFHLGLEVGNRATFRFFLRGGASWLDVSTAHFQGGGSSLGNPSYSGWLAPSGKLGFSAYF